jgi:hypothetical protein
LEKHKVLFRPWLYYGYIEIPEMEGYKPNKLFAATEDGKDGVKIHYLKLD